jgi:hypothetical protein
MTPPGTKWTPVIYRSFSKLISRDVMSDTLRRKKLRRTALLGSAMLALVCMAIFTVARLFVA